MDTLRRNTGHGEYLGSITTNTCLSGTVPMKPNPAGKPRSTGLYRYADEMR